ncbi:SAM-dependent methyltransferase [Paenibacillus sp. BGI2013]|uniref:class I SAM-dependent methyltransferase n=1 Tax=Paenibacillus sp. BGI2013 TaxID=2058902 RepID=UPI000C6D7789|nr:class I SAM-dependent methyltransferase [Paenibacillus sp. BGI2013]PKQ89652.1 SAM-dependent methyltransferase [Paenibacillus sp. BGI2013]
MITLVHFQTCLSEFAEKFDKLASKYDHTIQHSAELEAVINDYSRFVTDQDNKATWEQLEHSELEELDSLVWALRNKSAQCVAIMEKYRALKLENGDVQIADYFKNIEECIDKEFGSFHVTSDSNVLLVGSGSFPMTPLLIAKRTGAQVVGIDIDEESITLGRKVVETLGTGLKIRLESTLLENLEYTKEATHIIFSSTVAPKYELLDQLHALTNAQVVVAMRYGDQLKSLFNYPMIETDSSKWKLVDTILRPDDVFDIALYQKA